MKTVAETSAEALPPLELRPSLWGAFVGMWVLTWRGQLTPKRLWNAVGFLFAIPTIAFLTTDSGDPDQLLDWVLRFHLFLVLPLHCLFVFGPLIRDELQADTLPFMITRPVRRWRLYLLKFVCAAIVMQVLLLLNGAIFAGVAFAKGLSGLAPLLPLFLLCQSVAALAYGALAGLLGLLSKKFMVLGVVYGFVVEVGIGNLPTNAHSVSIAYHLRTMLGNNADVAAAFAWPAGPILPALSFVFIVFSIAMAFGALVFNVLEYNHGDDTQK